MKALKIVGIASIFFFILIFSYTTEPVNEMPYVCDMHWGKFRNFFPTTTAYRLGVDVDGQVTREANPKRVESYSGVTNASGVYTVTFPTAFSVAPNIQANPIGGSTEIFLKIVSVSTTGFTINVFQRANVLSLALSTATTPVSGANVDVLITEK